MRNVFRGQINKGEITFGTEYNEARFRDFAKKIDKKRIILTLDEPSSSQLRRFFEGAVVPAYAYQQFVPDKAKGIYRRFTFGEARESLKLEFNPIYMLRRTGKKHIVAGSTAKFNKMEFNAFLLKIQDWFMENGYQFPDSKDYKKWQDSSPDVGEIYPVLAKIIEISDMRLKELRGGEEEVEQELPIKKMKITDIDLQLAILLYDLIARNTPTVKRPDLKKWADHVRLMRERDKRTPQQIEFLIEWSQQDAFWSGNILSTKKLREKFDTLVSQIKSKGRRETKGKEIIGLNL